MIKGLFQEDVDQSTPQLTIEGFKDAIVAKKWERALRYLGPKARKGLIGALLMGSGYATDGDPVATPKLIKVMQRHGLRKQDTLDMTKADLPAIARDLMKWSDQHLPADKQLDLADNMVQTQYSRWRIEGDRAYVIATCKGRKSETRLKCINGRWFLI